MASEIFEALDALYEGLCEMRTLILRDPQAAIRLADAMHNLPLGLAGQERITPAYQAQMVAETRALLAAVRAGNSSL